MSAEWEKKKELTLPYPAETVFTTLCDNFETLLKKGISEFKAMFDTYEVVERIDEPNRVYRKNRVVKNADWIVPKVIHSYFPASILQELSGYTEETIYYRAKKEIHYKATPLCSKVPFQCGGVMMIIPISNSHCKVYMKLRYRLDRQECADRYPEINSSVLSIIYPIIMDSLPDSILETIRFIFQNIMKISQKEL